MKGNKPEDEAKGALEPQTFTLCGVQGCCPTVTVNAENVVITDDFGGKVTLSIPEFAELQNIKQ